MTLSMLKLQRCPTLGRKLVVAACLGGRIARSGCGVYVGGRGCRIVGGQKSNLLEHAGFRLPVPPSFAEVARPSV